MMEAKKERGSVTQTTDIHKLRMLLGLIHSGCMYVDCEIDSRNRIMSREGGAEVERSSPVMSLT